VTNKHPALSSNDDQGTSKPTLEAANLEVLPSINQAQSEEILLPSLLKRLGELEEKVDTLQSKPSEMPYEKEELLNAAVCRVDALEAELIATKKVECCIFVCHKKSAVLEISFIIAEYMSKPLRYTLFLLFLSSNLKLKTCSASC
jgi:hypothetical protein